VDYARFLALQRADAARSAAVLRESPSPACDASRAREVQGLTHYLAWSQAREPDRAEILRQARAFLPVDANLFYALASSDRVLAVAQQLVAAGEKVGVQDRRQMDALAYALRNGDKAVARRLLRLGAQPTAEVGPERMPAALIPVLTRDFDGIRLLQRAGVDYTRLRYQGNTAIDHARSQGDSKLLQVLDPKGGSTQGA
jgi:ankyrin repeat protein